MTVFRPVSSLFSFCCITRVLWRAVLASLALSVPAHSYAATVQQIWLSPAPRKEYAKLFSHEGEWSKSLRGIDVVELQTYFVRHASDSTLRTVIAFLEARHLSLALEAPILSATPGECGLGIEGSQQPGVIQGAIEKLHRLGAPLEYVAMDEPLWFGHMANVAKANGAYACQMTIDAVARNAAANVAIIRHYYPDVLIGDEEPLPNPYKRTDVPADFWAQMQTWADDFKKDTGRPLAFIHFDIGWFPSGSAEEDARNQTHWLAALRRGIAFTQANDIRSGIFYNGNPGDRSGVAWDDQAVERFQYVEGVQGLKFDDVIFATWMREPAAALPETVPGTMTNLVLRYLEFKHIAGN